jgi:hypothetical protein
MRRALLLAFGLVVSVSGCRRSLSDAEARKLVETYNARLVDAYRTADVLVVSPVVSPTEEKKLTGLIGVKVDNGIALDASLLELRFGQIERGKDQVTVRSSERWFYRDRRIGTGEQVGEESSDSYEMLYRLVRHEGKWVVDAVEFTKEPTVGRKSAPGSNDAKVLHGMELAGDPVSAGTATAAPASSSPRR